MHEARIAELLHLAETAAAEATSARNEANGRRLAEVSDELEAATEQCLAAGDARRALSFGASLRQHWQDTGHVDLGRKLLEAALALPGADLEPGRAWARVVAGELAFRQGDQEVGRAHSERAIAEAHELDLPVIEALGHLTLSRIALRDGDGGTIEREARIGLEIAGDDPLVRRSALHMFGWAAHTSHGVEASIPLFEASLAYRRELGDRFGEAVEYANLGDFAAEMGDDLAAARYLRGSLTIAWDLQNLYLLPSLVLSVAVLLGRRGEHARAVPLLAAADAAYARGGLVPDPGPGREAAKARADAEVAISVEAFAALWRNGTALPLDKAVELADRELVAIIG